MTLYVPTDSQRRDPKPRCIHEKGHVGAHSFRDYEACGKRHGNAIARCELPVGHEKQEALNRQRNQQGARRKPLAQKTHKQELLDARWEGVKDAFIYVMSRYEQPHCEFCGVPGNHKTLDMHHLRRRGQGGEYSARNGALACNRFNVHGENNCHAKLDGNVLMWSSSGLEQL